MKGSKYMIGSVHCPHGREAYFKGKSMHYNRFRACEIEGMLLPIEVLNGELMQDWKMLNSCSCVRTEWSRNTWPCPTYKGATNYALEALSSMLNRKGKGGWIYNTATTRPSRANNRTDTSR